MSSKCSTLLIDDDTGVLDACTQLLERSGYRISVCNDPFEAQAWIQPDWPDIVLSDVCIPGCSGVDLMMLFHQDDQQLPVLLITGHDNIPMAVDVMEKGTWDFLQKPVDPGKLLSLVEEALRQHQSVIIRHRYCQQTLQVELMRRSEWINQYR